MFYTTLYGMLIISIQCRKVHVCKYILMIYVYAKYRSAYTYINIYTYLYMIYVYHIISLCIYYTYIRTYTACGELESRNVGTTIGSNMNNIVISRPSRT